MKPASRELKEAFWKICPNTADLPTNEWLRLVAKTLGLTYPRVLRFWRDNRCVIKPFEKENIEAALALAKKEK